MYNLIHWVSPSPQKLLVKQRDGKTTSVFLVDYMKSYFQHSSKNLEDVKMLLNKKIS